MPQSKYRLQPSLPATKGLVQTRLQPTPGEVPPSGGVTVGARGFGVLLL